MKKTIISLVIFLVCGSPLVIASPGIEKDLMAPPSMNTQKMSFFIKENTKQAEKLFQSGQKNSNPFYIQPLHLSRNFSTLNQFNHLPADFQLSLKQFYIEYETDSQWTLSSNTIQSQEIKKEGSSTAIQTFKASKQILNLMEEGLVANAFIEVNQPTENPDGENANSFVSLGAKTQGTLFNMHWNADFTYEEQLAQSITSSSTVTAGVASKMKIEPIFVPTEITLNWDYAAKRAMSDEAQLKYNQETNSGDIFSPNISNISILNVSLAFAPKKKMFMSLEYYHYLQNQVQIESFSNNLSVFSAPEYTDGHNRQLGQELNIKAHYLHSTSVVSQLFAGWFDPGSAYGQADDNKTFEIRGEIIVNF